MELTHTKIKAVQTALMKWYPDNCRQLPWRGRISLYRVWVSEVMLQQTLVKTVVPYYLKFMERWPRPENLAAADLESVLKAWEGLGYYARARNLHKAAGIVIRDMGGMIPEDYKGFKNLPGVGDYIASAVLSIARSKPHAVVDGNVKRVLSRLLCVNTPVNRSPAHKTYKAIATTLLYEKDPGTYNQAVMELGALICTPKSPKCKTCPLARECCAFNKEATADFPRRTAKKKGPTVHIAAGIVKKDGKVLITKRKLDGLLGGLWEFPGGKVKPDESPEQACLREIHEETGITARNLKFLTKVFHAYTHFKIEMDVFFCDYVSGRVILNGPIAHRWVRVNQLDKFAFPKANLKFMELITAHGLA